MATYTKVYNNPYPDGWKDGKDGKTPVTADILNNQTETFESIEQYLADNPIEQGGGSGETGTTDYNDLTNKPTINGVEIVGDLTAEDLGLSGGGGGTSDYEALNNLPSIENVELKGNVTLAELSTKKQIRISWSDYQALSTEEKNDFDIVYLVYDYPENAITAINVVYDNGTSNLTANNTQDAIDELENKIEQIANNQIPEEYLKEAVDDYVNNNSAGFATQTDISNLSSEIVEIKDNIIDILYDSKGNLDFSLTWENKQISNQEEQISGKRILSNIIYIPKDCTLVLLDSNYNYTIHNYDENGNHIVGGNTWFTEPYALKENTYVRIQIRKSTDENFSATNFDYKNVIEITRNIVIDYHNLSETLKAQIGVPSKTVDLFIFMGQSNMAGRGETNETWTETAPIIIDGAGYEFRAISDNTKLYPIAEPFGVNENKSDGINDGNMKTGSMVTAFANAYYSLCKVPIIGVSASKGGSKISEWQPNGVYLTDAIQRLNDCVAFLENNGYSIRHKYMLWCQGESDGDYGTSKEEYKSLFNNMLAKMIESGIEKLFMVRIGNANISSDLNRYTAMIQWQTEISQTNENVVMVSTDFAGMRDRGLMKDDFHYYQAGYNEVGTYAGVNTAFYVNNGKEPTMYDTEYDNLYFSKKN